tara:strand:+ start:10137 stop:10337 length:201 start_codon:yes stop_codon:yes gene_type:complete
MDLQSKMVETPHGVGLCRIVLNGQAIVYFIVEPFYAYDLDQVKLQEPQDELLMAQIEKKAEEELSR